MNGDGLPDILSGAYWYENPGPKGGEWKRHQYREVGTMNEFVSDSGEWAIDVNHDGAPDVVTVGWMTNGVWWYENPKKIGAEWKRHFIADSYDTEGGWMADINGDGKPDLVFAHYNHSGILWIDFSGSEPKVHHVGTREQDGHGIGVADIDGDGKADILTPTGWFRQIDADKDQWEWHPDWHLGDTGFPIIGYDVLNNGKTDLIYGQGHSYGLYWLEQQGDGASRRWIRHAIDESFSQSHALALTDIDGDGEPELITGKRYRGHSGHDAGSYDPLVVFYYKINARPASSHATRFRSMELQAWVHRSSRWTWTETATSILPLPEKPECIFLRSESQPGAQGAARKRDSARQELALPRRRTRDKAGGRAEEAVVRCPCAGCPRAHTR